MFSRPSSQVVVRSLTTAFSDAEWDVTSDVAGLLDPASGVLAVSGVA